MKDEFQEFFSASGQGAAQIMNTTSDEHLLKGTRRPPILLKSERPSHRMTADLMARGYTQKEIAATVGVTPTAISVIARQPHVQQRLANEIRNLMNEDQAVVEVIRQNVVHAVETLAEITTDKEAKRSDRIAAAEALLNRRYGKPNQPINRGGEVDLNAVSITELAAQLPTTQTSTESSQS